MRNRSIISIVLLFAVSIVLMCADSYALELKSSAFESNGNIPQKYTCKGEDISPALSWDGVPDGTKSFVLIMDDPDAPMGTWIHWVIYNIPGSVKFLKEKIPGKLTIYNGAMQGINSFRWAGYGGPCPPAGPEHRYIFQLYALDASLEIKPGASKGDVTRAMQGHVLGQATLIGVFAS